MHGRFRVLRRTLVAATALAAVALPATAALTPGLAQATSTAKTALIDEESVSTGDGITKEGKPISLEQWAAENAGYKVTVRTGEEWEEMSAAEFAQFQVLIVGDPQCDSTAVSAVESAKTWTAVVMGAGPNPAKGNRVVIGTDPEYHYIEGEGNAQPTDPENPATAGAEHLVQDGIAFAGGVEGATGVYFDTSCSDLEEPAPVVKRADVRHATAAQQEIEGPDGRDKTEVLDRLTTSTAAEPWSEDVQPPCGGSVAQIASNAVFDTGPTKLEDSDIQGWECSVHVTFPAFPSDWHALAVATDTATHPTCGTDPETGEPACGEAYVLLAGRGIVSTSQYLTLSPASGEEEAGPGQTHTVTATVTEPEPEPVAFTARPALEKTVPKEGAAVAFVVTGQNEGVGGTCTYPEGGVDAACLTNSEGKVDFTYNDAKGAGDDTINASVVVGESTEQATAAMTWTPDLTLTPPTGEQEAGASHTHAVTATVTEEAERPEVSPAVRVRAPGRKVTFTVSGQNNGVTGTCTTPEGAPDPECTTNPEGQVVFTYPDTNGAGSDTITASVVLNEGTVEATAQMMWKSPPKPEEVSTTATTATTATTQPTPKAGVLAFGAARLASTHACVASSGYLASVSGKLIGSVTFMLDGHKIKTLTKANSHGAYALRVAVKAGHVHHLTIHVAFTSASSTKTLTINKTLARCAAVHHVTTPRFTG